MFLHYIAKQKAPEITSFHSAAGLLVKDGQTRLSTDISVNYSSVYRRC